jgi:hypothetical protein
VIHRLDRDSGYRLRSESSKAQEALLLPIKRALPAGITNIGGIEACLGTGLVRSSVERYVPAAVKLEDFQALLWAIEVALVVAGGPKVLF